MKNMHFPALRPACMFILISAMAMTTSVIRLAYLIIHKKIISL